MGKFDNLETTLISRWYGNQIEDIVLENKSLSKFDLIARVSEEIEDLIKEELLLISDCYISEIVGASFDKIDYQALIDYYK